MKWKKPCLNSSCYLDLSFLPCRRSCHSVPLRVCLLRGDYWACCFDFLFGSCSHEVHRIYIPIDVRLCNVHVLRSFMMFWALFFIDFLQRNPLVTLLFAFNTGHRMMPQLILWIISFILSFFCQLSDYLLWNLYGHILIIILISNLLSIS